jgi:glycosyltransferase involved in cell wall biosynthesis
MSVLMTQIGARQHYEPARMAEKDHFLARLVTDIYCPFPSTVKRLARWTGSRILMNLSGRHPVGIPRRRVVGLNRIALISAIRNIQRRSRTELYRSFIAEGRMFASACITYADVEHDCTFGFSSASLELLKHEKLNGVRTVLDQIDGARVEEKIIEEEEKRHRRLSLGYSPIPEEYFARLEEEWSVADCVLVNSQWSYDALSTQGVPRHKLRIVPLAYESPNESMGAGAERVERRSELRVLWLGSLCLRKGLYYALEAATQLEKCPVSFTFAGPLLVDLSEVALPANVKYVGRIPRSQAADLYRAHDVFILPTLSDGFAITQIEAMSYGLPVIATARCGKVVEDGISGLIVEPYSGNAIARALLHLLEGEFLEQMREEATARAKVFKPAQVWPGYRRVLAGRS